LKEILVRNETVSVWDKAVLYHAIHAIMLYLLAGRTPFRRVPWIAFAVGILLFSGSLYVLAVTNIRSLGMITPFGGVSFLVGWGCLLCCPGCGPDPKAEIK
jgi:uncharacterized membrane protein YgdD (TMEM256/DUF423 family)